MLFWNSLASSMIQWMLAMDVSSWMMLLLLFNRLVVSGSLQPHGLRHMRTPYPSLSPRVCPSSCSLHRWCHPAILSFDALFSFCSIFLSIRDFSNESSIRIRWPIYWSFSFSISHSSEYSGLISLKINWFDLLAGVFSSTIVQRHQFFGGLPSLRSSSHNHMFLEWFK